MLTQRDQEIGILDTELTEVCMARFFLLIFIIKE